MKDRIRQVMSWAKLSQQDFATYLEISPASLSSIFNGRTNPTNNHVQAIHRAFPEINVSWLMFGEGEMLPSGGEGSPSIGDAVLSSSSQSPRVQTSELDLGATGTLFSDSAFISPAGNEKTPQNLGVNLQEAVRQAAFISGVGKNAKNIDNQKRNIKEIRVFFDDGTYESFVPSTSK